MLLPPDATHAADAKKSSHLHQREATNTSTPQPPTHLCILLAFQPSFRVYTF